MAEIATWLPLAMNIGGSLLSAEGSSEAAEGSRVSARGANEAADAAIVMGTRQRAAAEFKAAQMRSQAGQVVAASQRAGDSEERKAKLLFSRALAVGAASGGGVSDPAVVKLLSNIAGEGSYRRAVSLYEGEDRARMLRMSAAAADYEGAIAEEAGGLQAKAYRTQAEAYEAQAETHETEGLFGLVKGGASLFSKYGGGFPGIGGASGGGGFTDLPGMSF